MKTNLIDQIKAQRPLVLVVTNFITAGAVANVLSAAGMSPMMPSDFHEATELTQLADAVTINIGSVDSDQAALIDAVMATATQLSKPIVLDPVAVSASQARQSLVQSILKKGVTLIRGNASEIAYLAGIQSQARGIDAGDENNPAYLAQLCAQKQHCLVVLSGPIDYVSDGKTTVECTMGSPMMPKIVGTGDMLSAFLSGCLSLPISQFEAVKFGTEYFGQVGQRADTGKLGDWSANFLTILDQANSKSWKGVGK
ncbi:hydroxyethylthiazole kinase [Lactobacillus alvi]|uniref:Hydroxyethylthiazole kinase n=1 Tax=Limosilactobacillus alvi TaxID=990412 RepID=A0ABS2EQC5_9LACO|nr:hydroxyethylthiazole kinase [Limosilactobacillus alvi]MBM6754425.1 hydroxyethylthiazole kinase [Limosilactobacillus alvi]